VSYKAAVEQAGMANLAVGGGIRQPDGLRNGTLLVNMGSSVWLSEIVRYRRKEILDRLQTTFGRDTIKKISFRVGGTRRDST